MPSTVVHAFANAAVHARRYSRGMDEERPPHFLRQWREHTKVDGKPMTQQQLADAIGTTKSQISELERFNLQLSPKWLRVMAPVFRIQQGWIIDYNPEELDSDIIEIWTSILDEDRPSAVRALQGFIKRTGTDD